MAAAETWLDGQSSAFFLSGLQNLVAVACFLPGRAKDLTAARYYRHKNYGKKNNTSKERFFFLYLFSFVKNV